MIYIRNILLTKSLDIKIGDFGSSTRTESNYAYTAAGTLDYMSPEILERRTYSYNTDVW